MDLNNHLLNASELISAESFDAQVQYVLQTVRLMRCEVEELRQLFRDLESVLQTHWQGCQIFPFGSIITGLGIKTSDVDCYVSIPDWLENPGENYVRTARNLLCRQPDIFQNVFAISAAKVPIVKFFHVPTQINCDVNFKSLMGVQNSKLIGYMLHMDERALPLAILIKYWSKVHKLTGTNLLPNYALTMLVIFYLQQKSILPPVLLLQEAVEPEMIDHWNSAVDNSYQYMFTNNETLYSLIGGFFKYYSTFDYQRYIISPYTGCPIDKQQFMAIESVPYVFELYKINILKKLYRPFNITPKICVQDPFEHARNCTGALTLNLIMKLVKCFHHAAKLFDECSSEEFLQEIYFKRPGPLISRHRLRKKVKKRTPVYNNLKRNIPCNINAMYMEMNKVKSKGKEKKGKEGHHFNMGRYSINQSGGSC